MDKHLYQQGEIQFSALDDIIPGNEFFRKYYCDPKLLLSQISMYQDEFSIILNEVLSE